MIFLIITSSFLFITSLIFVIKYIILKKTITQYEDIGTGRIGFYTMKSSDGDYSGIVHINELDRYTNGFSKISINRIENTSRAYYRDSAENWINNNFRSLMNTNDITWLESEGNIKRNRKEKLDALKKL